MNIANRLDEAMRDAGIISQSALARASGVPQPTINRILKGSGKQGPEAQTLRALAAACNVTFEWLHEGREPRSSQLDRAEEAIAIPGRVKVDDGDDDGSIRIPLLQQRIHGGTPGFTADDEYVEVASFTISRNWVQQKGLDPDLLFAMRAAGLSMYSTIKPNDIVVLSRQFTEPIDGEIFGVNHKGKALLKRMSWERGGWQLLSDNKLPEFPPQPVDEDTRIVGRLVTKQEDFI